MQVGSPSPSTAAGSASTIPCILDPELLERITARRAELDEAEERLAKELAEVRDERDELAAAEQVLERVSGQLADERASASPAPGQVGGRAVMLIPPRTQDVNEAMLPPDYQRILAAVRQAAGPVMARQVGDSLGTDVSVRSKLEPLRGKLLRLADRGWLRKLPDGRFTGRDGGVCRSSCAGRLFRCGAARLTDCLDVSDWKLIYARSGKPVAMPANRLTRYVNQVKAEKWRKQWKILDVTPEQQAC